MSQHIQRRHRGLGGHHGLPFYLPPALRVRVCTRSVTQSRCATADWKPSTGPRNALENVNASLRPLEEEVVWRCRMYGEFHCACDL